MTHPGAGGQGMPENPGTAGLAAERTALAWVRMGLSLLAVPGALLAYAVGRSWLALATAAVAGTLGLWLLLVSLRNELAVHEASQGQAAHLATIQVLLTGAAAATLAAAGLVLVFARG